MFSVGDLFSQASPIGRAMQSPTRSPMTFFDLTLRRTYD